METHQTQISTTGHMICIVVCAARVEFKAIEFHSTAT